MELAFALFLVFLTAMVVGVLSAAAMH